MNTDLNPDEEEEAGEDSEISESKVDSNKDMKQKPIDDHNQISTTNIIILIQTEDIPLIFAYYNR